jgi:antitoxin (DNA-binding transcriptional repressor) of toxin-antitoxin stability system
MKTLSPTQARANMTRWLDAAVAGHSIGITHKGRIIKLQPVPVTEDWAADEYGLTGEELDQAASNLLQTGQELLESGKTVSLDEFKKRRKAR